MRSEQMVAATLVSKSRSASSDSDKGQSYINISGRVSGFAVPRHWSISMFSRKFALISTFLFLAGTASCLHAQAGDPAAIQQKLYTQFKLTTITTDRSDIVTAGDVVAIQKPGLIMYATASPLPPSNTYKNGRIGQGWGGFGKDLMIGMMTPGGTTPANTYPQRQFVPEEKCWVTGIQVQKDGILFQLYSDPYDDIRYYANLKIPFPSKKEMPSVDAAMQLVAEVLTVVPQDQGAPDQASQGAPAATPAPAPATGTVQSVGLPEASETYISMVSGSQLILNPDKTSMVIGKNGQRSPGHWDSVTVSGTKLVYGEMHEGSLLTLVPSLGGRSAVLKVQGSELIDTTTSEEWDRTEDAQAQAPEAAPPRRRMPDIAPPPPPADAPPPTIDVGQTMDQVTAGFGQPLRVARVGAKTIFYYKDMKVTFTNGKVSNVE